MRPIVYDVAMTLDGFICREDGSADGFVPDGEHVRDYLQRLQGYGTVLMGRKTYEFGYQFGLEPGQRAYPHMDHHIFSNTLQLESGDLKVVAVEEIVERATSLKQHRGRSIYLCGGGQLAGRLLEHQLIDQLIVKLNPVIFGAGIPAFGDSRKQVALKLLDHHPYANGVVLQAYDIQYT